MTLQPTSFGALSFSFSFFLSTCMFFFSSFSFYFLTVFSFSLIGTPKISWFLVKCYYWALSPSSVLCFPGSYPFTKSASKESFLHLSSPNYIVLLSGCILKWGCNLKRNICPNLKIIASTTPPLCRSAPSLISRPQT